MKILSTCIARRWGIAALVLFMTGCRPIGTSVVTPVPVPVATSYVAPLTTPVPTAQQAVVPTVQSIEDAPPPSIITVEPATEATTSTP